jgi:hypothetical protein
MSQKHVNSLHTDDQAVFPPPSTNSDERIAPSFWLRDVGGLVPCTIVEDDPPTNQVCILVTDQQRIVRRTQVIATMGGQTSPAVEVAHVLVPANSDEGTMTIIMAMDWAIEQVAAAWEEEDPEDAEAAIQAGAAAATPSPDPQPTVPSAHTGHPGESKAPSPGRGKPGIVWPTVAVGTRLLCMDRTPPNIGETIQDLGDRVKLRWRSPSGYSATGVIPKSQLCWLDGTPLSKGPQSKPDLASLSDAELGIRPARSYKKRRVEWLLPNRLPRRDYTLIAGRGKQGKSQLTMALGAVISTGGPWWDGSGTAPKGHVLYISAEDDPERIIVPRLEALGADLDKITILEAKYKLTAPDGTKLVKFTTLQDLDHWREVFGRINDPVLLVVDPLPSYLGKSVNDRSNNEVRAILGPFVELVKEFGMTLVGVTHFGKAIDARTAADKVLDSIAYVNLARAVHYVARDPDHTGRILFMPGPCNYAKADLPSLAFTLIERTIPDDEGGTITLAVPQFDPDPVQVDPDDIVNRQSKNHTGSRGPDPAKTTLAAIALVEAMKDQGPVFLGSLFDTLGAKGFLGERRWNPKTDRFEWSGASAIYRAAAAVANLPAPHDGWQVVTSKDDPSLRSTNGHARWELRRPECTF